jgi:hypothetical protein
MSIQEKQLDWNKGEDKRVYLLKECSHFMGQKIYRCARGNDEVLRNNYYYLLDYPE